MKKHVRSIPFSEKHKMILKLSELHVAACAQFARKNEKSIVTLWISSTKNLFLTA